LSDFQRKTEKPFGFWAADGGNGGSDDEIIIFNAVCLIFLLFANWSPFCVLPKKQLSVGHIFFVACPGRKNCVILSRVKIQPICKDVFSYRTMAVLTDGRWQLAQIDLEKG